MNDNELANASQAFSVEKLRAVVDSDPDFKAICDWFNLPGVDYYKPLLTSNHVYTTVDPFPEARQHYLREEIKKAAEFIANRYAVDPFSPAHFLAKYGLGFTINHHLVNELLGRPQDGPGSLQFDNMPALCIPTTNPEAIANGATGMACYHRPQDAFGVRLLTKNVPKFLSQDTLVEIAKLEEKVEKCTAKRERDDKQKQISNLKKTASEARALFKAGPFTTPAEKNGHNGTFTPLFQMPMFHDPSAGFVVIEGAMKACSIADACTSLNKISITIMGCRNWIIKESKAVAEHWRFNDRQAVQKALPWCFTPDGLQRRHRQRNYFIADSNACGGDGQGDDKEVFQAVSDLTAYVTHHDGKNPLTLVRFYGTDTIMPTGISGIDDLFRHLKMDNAARVSHLKRCMEKYRVATNTLENTPPQTQAGCKVFTRNIIETLFEGRIKSYVKDNENTMHFCDDDGVWDQFFPTKQGGTIRWEETQFGSRLSDLYDNYVNTYGKKDKEGMIVGAGATTSNLEKALSNAFSYVPVGIPLIPTETIKMDGGSIIDTSTSLLPVFNGYIVLDVINRMLDKYSLINTYKELQEITTEILASRHLWYLDRHSPLIFRANYGYSVDLRHLQPYQDIRYPMDFLERVDEEDCGNAVKLMAALGKPLPSDTALKIPMKKLIMIQGERDCGKTKSLQWMFDALGNHNNHKIKYGFRMEGDFQNPAVLHAKYLVIDEYNHTVSNEKKDSELKQITGDSDFSINMKNRAPTERKPIELAVFLITNHGDVTPFISYEDITRRTTLITIFEKPKIDVPLPAPSPVESAQFFMECVVAGLLMRQGKISMNNTPNSHTALNVLSHTTARGNIATGQILRALKYLFEYCPCEPGDLGFDARSMSDTKGTTIGDIQKALDDFMDNSDGDAEFSTWGTNRFRHSDSDVGKCIKAMLEPFIGYDIPHFHRPRIDGRRVKLHKIQLKPKGKRGRGSFG